MDDTLSFGIGCFHFGVREEPPFQFYPDQYIEGLKEDLQKITNITDLKVNFRKWPFDVENTVKEKSNINSGPGFIPNNYFFDFLYIEFNIYIPIRISKDIFKNHGVYGLKRDLKIPERFKIIINYAYYFPVTYILILDDSDLDPSDFVMIIREFFEKQLENSDYLKFESLGPSPFHVDCYCKPSDTDKYARENWLFYDIHNLKKGYDEIIFYYNQCIFNNKMDAFEAIINEIEDEISFFL